MGNESAGSVLRMLGKRYHIDQPAGISQMADRIQFPNEADNIYAGVCLLLGDPGKWEAWRSCYKAAFPAGTKSSDDVMALAESFLSKTEPGRQAKPQTYYERIYANREALFHHSPYALEEQLTRAVQNADREGALNALQAISRHGEKAVVARDALRSARNSMIGSIAFLARAAIQGGVNADAAFALSDSLIQQVEDLKTREAVLAFEETILLQFIDLVNERLENAYSPTILRVMHYIENNLDKKLRLTDAAAYTGVHPAYLSARFEKETGCAFSHYVMQRKIKESTYFVRHSGYSVPQIALLYGFSSQSYYITSFKRVMGMTPLAYRRKYLSE